MGPTAQGGVSLHLGKVIGVMEERSGEGAEGRRFGGSCCIHTFEAVSRSSELTCCSVMVKSRAVVKSAGS